MKHIKIVFIAISITLAPAWPVLAGNTDSGHSGHGTHQITDQQGDGGHQMQHGGGHTMGKPASGHGTMDHSGHSGDLLHESEVNGYKFTYHTIDMASKMAFMKGKEHITHHMMVYITGPDGQTVTNAKVGYLIQGPERDQKLMCMGMGGGYGADVSFKEPGKYTVKTKAVAGDVTLMDAFEHEVK